MKWLILVVLAVGTIPAVYAQSAESNLIETGQDYFKYDNMDGTFTWQSHENYILDYDGTWIPYRVQEDANTVQVEMDGGKFVFDKNECAVSAFKGDELVIDSDSYVVRTATINTDNWSNLAVNDEQCSTVTTQNEDSVIINLIKQNDEGVFDTEYVLDHGQMKTTAKFTNELYENNKFAFTQTLQLPDVIELEGQEIILSELDGMTFDRQTLEANHDVMISAKDLFYNAGLGFDQLWAVSIYDGKVALDYGNQGETKIAINETIELDPTITLSTSHSEGYYSNSAATCSSSFYNGNYSPDISTGSNGSCKVMNVEYSLASIPSSVTLTAATWDFVSSSSGYTDTCRLVDITLQPSVSSDSSVWSQIYSQSAIVSGFTCANTSGSINVLSDVQSHFSSGVWYAGLRYDNMANSSGSTTFSTKNLVVTYTVPTAPNAITDLSASFNSPNVDLSWSLPSDGGSAITSFKVYRDSGSGFSLYDTVSSSTATSYQDTNPVTGATNFYKVNAVNSVGEASDSNSASAFVGVPPDAPTGVSTSIADADAAPLTITVSWTSPSNVGTGTLTGFEIYRDGTLITTTGLVTTYDDTVSSSGTYVYKVRAVSTHGTSGDSNTSSISTPTVPTAINDLTGQADSNVQTSISWTAPSTGGSAITQYKVFRDSTNIANTTSTSYTDSGLTDGTTYLYNVFAQNNVGTSTKSNDLSLTTYTGVTGSITGTATTIGATTKIDVTPNVTAGTPTPTFNTFTVKEGTVTITTFTGTTGYVHHTDDSTHTYTIESTDSTHWENPTITGTVSGVQASYNPSWASNVSYNYTRSTNSFDLIVNRDVTPGWDLTCEYRTAAQASGNQTGTTGTGTNMYAFQDSQTISDGKHVYVTCTENNAIVVSFVSYGPNLITGGLQLLDAHFGDFLGAPAVLFFVILAAGMFTGRSANTGILVVLSIIGVLGFIGMVTIDEASWGFILIAGVLGLFVGKRFL